MYVFGTSTDYQTFADAISNVAMGTSLQSIDTIVGGGTGYTVGDILTFTGGTFTIAATAEVLTVAAGVITAVRIRNAGLYQTTPGDPVSVTGGTGTGATFNLTFDTNGWLRRRAINVTGAAQSATIAAGGTGYVVGDIVTLSGGTFTVAATFRVTAVSGGVVTSVIVVDYGNYTSNPGNPVSTTGGTGTGLTLTVTFGGSGEREVIMEGEGSGSDEIFVGWLSYFDSGTGARSWELAGFTGFDPALTWPNQPGISPGRNTGSTGGSFVPLSNTTITWWMSVTPRRIVFACKIGTYYGSGYLGFLNPFATAGEWPYPIYVCGTTQERFVLPSTSTAATSGIADPAGAGGGLAIGPGSVRTADGAWKQVMNSTTSLGVNSEGVLSYPGGRITNPSLAAGDDFFNAGVNWQQWIPAVSTTTQTNRLLPTEDGASDLYILVPCTLLESQIDPDVPVAVLGELDSVWWFDKQSVVVAENRLSIGDDRYLVLNSGTRSDNWAGWALKEA